MEGSAGAAEGATTSADGETAGGGAGVTGAYANISHSVSSEPTTDSMVPQSKRRDHPHGTLPVPQATLGHLGSHAVRHRPPRRADAPHATPDEDVHKPCRFFAFAFAREFGDKLLDELAREVDRMEAELEERFPRLEYVDLEAD